MTTYRTQVRNRSALLLAAVGAVLLIIIVSSFLGAVRQLGEDLDGTFNNTTEEQH